MLTLLLSTLGIGGIGALAFFFVPGAAKVMLQIWDWITASKVNLLTAACLVLAGTAYWCWHGWEKSEKVLASTEQAYRNAQADAKREQEALNARLVATNEAVNKGSTNDNAQRVFIARSAVAAYARLHPVAGCSSDQAVSAAVSDRAEMASGTSGETGMVAIPVADLDTLAAGTVRAESCRAWGQSMIDAGLATAGD